MKKSITILLFTITLFLLIPSNVYADVRGFINEIDENETYQNEDKPKKNKPRKSDDSDEETKSTILSIIGALWAANNLYVTFGDYPYTPKQDAYVMWDIDSEYTTGKFMRGIIGVGFCCMQLPGDYDQSLGYNAEFKSHLYKFFGFNCENWSLSDPSGKISALRVGGFISLFQGRYFTADLYCHWVRMYNDLLNDGLAIGFDFELFPIKPLVIRNRIGYFPIASNTDIFEVNTSIGIMQNRFEIYLMHRYWNIENDTKKSGYHGITSGLRLYF